MSFIQVFLFIIQSNIIYGSFFDCKNLDNSPTCHSGVNCPAGEDCIVFCQGISPGGGMKRGGCENIIINGAEGYKLRIDCRETDEQDPIDACKNAIINTNRADEFIIECSEPSACPSMNISGTILSSAAPLSGRFIMQCSYCAGSSININSSDILLNCNGEDNACEGISITGQGAEDFLVNCVSILAESPGTNHCGSMTIDASLSASLLVQALPDSRASDTLRHTNIICPNSGNCSISVTDSHVSVLQCATIQAPGDIEDLNILDCNGVECFDDSDTCGTTVQYININTDESCFITNSDALWARFECSPTTPPTATPTVGTATPSSQTMVPSNSPTHDDSSSDSSSDSFDGMKIQSAHMEQSQSVRHVGNNVLIEMNVWNILGFLTLIQICIVCCWYTKCKHC